MPTIAHYCNTIRNTKDLLKAMAHVKNRYALAAQSIDLPMYRPHFQFSQ